MLPQASTLNDIWALHEQKLQDNTAKYHHIWKLMHTFFMMWKSKSQARAIVELYHLRPGHTHNDQDRHFSSQLRQLHDVEANEDSDDMSQTDDADESKEENDVEVYYNEPGLIRFRRL